MIILGIESSCDETACGIVDSKTLEVKANVLYTQLEEHTPYGGVVPEVAARSHLTKMPSIVEGALKQSGLGMSDIDLIAVTCGPGLMGPLLVGVAYAKGLGVSLDKPVVGVNHLEGHIAAAHLSYPDLQPPYICLTVSGGHTELTLVKENFEFELLGRTRDDAAGEAFDKGGKILGLGYPAGPIIGRLASTGNRKFFQFPRAMPQKTNLEFSYSGVKTSVLRYVEENGEEYVQNHINDICASLETAIVDPLVKKSRAALKKFGLKQIVVCGGVSANKHLRKRFEDLEVGGELEFYVPNFEYCTDNAAMIAGAAALRERAGLLNYNEIEVKSGLSLYKGVAR
ncbi:tRNA (adenosine(37)-N6)-threonylcarbamoyltransferase complex transferase subunit TsaD [bacterium]|nr:tRNA (adenosine(37)-N6)-threonylcarbamoyltransferase complex transferase subunit TsaD [bacterium]